YPRSLRAVLPGGQVAQNRSADAFLYKDTTKGIPAYVQFDAHLASVPTDAGSSEKDLVIFGMLVNAGVPSLTFSIYFGYSPDNGVLTGGLVRGDASEIVPSAQIEPPPTGWFQVKIAYDATMATASFAVLQGGKATTRVLRTVPDVATTTHIVCGATTSSDL